MWRGLYVKGLEAEFFVSCNIIGENWRSLWSGFRDFLPILLLLYLLELVNILNWMAKIQGPTTFQCNDKTAIFTQLIWALWTHNTYLLAKAVHWFAFYNVSSLEHLSEPVWLNPSSQSQDLPATTCLVGFPPIFDSLASRHLRTKCFFQKNKLNKTKLNKHLIFFWRKISKAWQRIKISDSTTFGSTLIWVTVRALLKSKGIVFWPLITSFIKKKD